MIVKLFGILDIFAGLVLIFSEIFNLVLGAFVVFLAVFLLLKGIFFIITDLDIISFLDVICGIFILFLITGDISSLIVYLIAVFLVQKGVFSLF